MDATNACVSLVGDPAAPGMAEPRHWGRVEGGGSGMECGEQRPKVTQVWNVDFLPLPGAALKISKCLYFSNVLIISTFLLSTLIPLSKNQLLTFLSACSLILYSELFQSGSCLLLSYEFHL